MKLTPRLPYPLHFTNSFTQPRTRGRRCVCLCSPSSHVGNCKPPPAGTWIQDFRPCTRISSNRRRCHFSFSFVFVRRSVFRYGGVRDSLLPVRTPRVSPDPLRRAPLVPPSPAPCGNARAIRISADLELPLRRVIAHFVGLRVLIRVGTVRREYPVRSLWCAQLLAAIGETGSEGFEIPRKQRRDTRNGTKANMSDLPSRVSGVPRPTRHTAEHCLLGRCSKEWRATTSTRGAQTTDPTTSSGVLPWRVDLTMGANTQY